MHVMQRSFNPVRAAGLGLASLMVSLTVSAQTFDAVRLQALPPGQDLAVVGAVLASGLAYPGTDKRRTQLLPLFVYQWANGWFAGVGNGVGLNFSADRASALGLRLTADFGRKESRSPALRGLGNIDPKPEIGAFHNVASASGVFGTSSLRLGSGNNGRGFVLDLGAGVSAALAPQWRLFVGVATTVANAAHQQAYFGVDAAQAQRSGYRVYEPKAGVRDARASTSITYAFDARSAVTAVVSLRRLLEDAADRPLTQDRDAASAVPVYTYGC